MFLVSSRKHLLLNNHRFFNIKRALKSDECIKKNINLLNY